jgi:hypothetical protein
LREPTGRLGAREKLLHKLKIIFELLSDKMQRNDREHPEFGGTIVNELMPSAGRGIHEVSGIDTTPYAVDSESPLPGDAVEDFLLGASWACSLLVQPGSTTDPHPYVFRTNVPGSSQMPDCPHMWRSDLLHPGFVPVHKNHFPALSFLA